MLHGLQRERHLGELRIADAVADLQCLLNGRLSQAPMTKSEVIQGITAMRVGQSVQVVIRYAPRLRLPKQSFGRAMKTHQSGYIT